MIDKSAKLPITQQCRLLNLSRSGVYYRPVPISPKDLELMRQIDEIHLAWPFYGSRNIRDELWGRGYDVGRDRVRRLMRLMGVEALYPKPRTSKTHPGHKKYPYLLRGLSITRPNQVWAADITYIPMPRGVFVTLWRLLTVGQPDGAVLAALEHPGQLVLCRSLTGSNCNVWLSGDIQHRSGQPVYFRGVYR